MSRIRILWAKLKGQVTQTREGEAFDAEIREHIELLVEKYRAQGMDPREATQAAHRQFGNVPLLKDRQRSLRGIVSPEEWWRDLRYGIRMLLKQPASTCAAVLSLALAMGGCLAVFQLVNALLLRPMHIANPHQLFMLMYPRMNAAGAIEVATPFDYPQFKMLKAAAGNDADLIAATPPNLSELSFGTDDQIERMRIQFVSGSLFSSFGIKPALGRVINANDDMVPGASAVALLSWNTWERRFAKDPNILGRKFRFHGSTYEIIGVAEKGFNGTDPAWATNIFVPTMMNAQLINQPDFAWLNIFVHLNPGVKPELVRQKLKVAERIDRQERVKRQHWPLARYQQYVAAELFLEPAAAGYSGLQRQYGRPLMILAMIVMLVLLIALVNVANLMTAHAQMRAHEMALRISIGASRARLFQLVIFQSALVGVVSCILGSLFGYWAAQFIVRKISTPSAPPVTLALGYDWRTCAFTVLLILLVSITMGSIPAWRASNTSPLLALRGDAARLKRKSMNILVGVQIGFCVLVLYVAGLFTSSLWRLNGQPLGFDPGGLINLSVDTSQDVPLADWREVQRELQATPGVSSVAISTWPLLFGPVWSEGVLIPGMAAKSEEADFLATSPDWLRTVGIRLYSGRELNDDDGFPGPVLVNEAFVRQYVNSQNPIGRSFKTRISGKDVECTVVGVVGDAQYADIHSSMPATVYLPFSSPQPLQNRTANFVVRTAVADPGAIAYSLRQKVSKIRSSFRVTDVFPQAELIDQQTIRERLLTFVSIFFAALGIALSVIGLYEVLNYSLVQRWRELGIRRALGAPVKSLAWTVTSGTVVMLIPGAFVGLGSGIACQRYFSSLLFRTSPLDPGIVCFSLAMTISIAFVAAAPIIERALRVDPADILRSE